MMRTGADEARSPKYSHVERERRWLVDPARLPPLAGHHLLIEDRYLLDTRFRLRRMTDSASGEVALKLAKKYEAADPLARPMVNAYLAAEEYAAFAALPANAIVKRRYHVDTNGLTFGVDRFDGPLAGLLLAEIEAEDARSLAAVATPRWAVRDVSHDPRYQGAALAAVRPQDVPGLLA